MLQALAFPWDFSISAFDPRSLDLDDPEEDVDCRLALSCDGRLWLKSSSSESELLLPDSDSSDDEVSSAFDVLSDEEAESDSALDS